ncbi:hypothetical protein CF327_g3992 [Tilletia walkeri]|nr:hypothetical protein CF327_g3992 [Tilletia walkeri]
MLRQSGDLSEATSYQDEIDCYRDAAAILQHTLAVASGRYLVPRNPLWRPTERLIDRLDSGGLRLGWRSTPISISRSDGARRIQTQALLAELEEAKTGIAAEKVKVADRDK